MNRLTLVIIAFFSLFLTACNDEKPSYPDPSKRSADTLHRAIYSAHLQLDPHFAKVTADASLVKDLFVGLTAFDRQGNVVPAVATEWFSDDGENWLFVLNDEARWSNGEPVIADDFVKSWQRLAHPENKSPLAYYLVHLQLANVKAVLRDELSPNQLGVWALNDNTLHIQLDKPNYRLPEMLAHSALLPTYQGRVPEAENLISNGSYQLKKLEKTHLHLQALEADTPFQQVYYHLITSIEDAAQFDLIENPKENYHQHEVRLPRLCSYYYEFNFREPILQQKAVRQAIRLMISPPEISEALGIPIHFVLPRTLFSVSDRMPYHLDIEPILARIGISPDNPIRLNVIYDSHELHSKVAHRVSRALTQSDLFRVQAQAVPFEELLAMREKGDFHLIRSGWCADHRDPVQFVQSFHSRSPDNKSGYTNEEIDQWIEKLHIDNLSQKARDQLIAQITHQLEQDVAIIPLFQYQRRISRDPSILGINRRNDSETIYSKDLTRQSLEEKEQ